MRLNYSRCEAGITLDIRQESGEILTESGSKSGKIIFTGPVYDRNLLRAWNTRADVFVFPSVYDTNGIVVREAAACGLASVLISGSCAAEGITHGRNGWLVEESGESIAALLKEISQNPEHMHETGQRAMDEIYISWDESVRNALDRYQVILEMKHAGTLKPRRNGKSDKFLNATTEVMDVLWRIYRRPKERMQQNLEGMQENFAEAENYFRKKKEGFKELKEELKQEWKKRNGTKN